ncbi:MAG: hypothetical protein JW808_06160 [Victivallales bacterium]|nr:hypothetical protein [Victivallales bacterium]
MQSEFKMRRSRVLENLRAGKFALCTKTNLSDPRASEIAAMSGFDCLWTCQEHVGNDYRSIQEQVLATKAHDCDLLCRVPKGSYSGYIRPLELDATGIMIPHVMSAREARDIVRTTRFHPVGRRPVDGGNADGMYCQIPFKEYLEQANRERFVVLQIEDPEPLEELDAIAAVGGYDMLFFGPGDFTHSIGDPGNFDNPRVKDARLRIADAANKHGKVAATVGSMANYRELLDIGYRFISIGSDVCALATAYSEIVRTVKGSRIQETKNIYGK